MSLDNPAVVRIGDVVERVTKGTTPTTHGYQYTKDGVAFVRVENLRNGVIDSSSLTTFISYDADRFLKRSSLEKDDVLVSIAGTIGRTAVVREQDLPANTNQAVAIIRGASKTFEPIFLRYALESPLLNRLLTGEARGGAMQNISLEDVKNVKVPVPPIDQQREIVAEIEKQFTRLDAGVAGLRRVQVNLKRYRAAVLKAACEGKLVPTEAELARQEGRTYETGAQLLERILTDRRQKGGGNGKYKEPIAPDKTNLSELPEGWMCGTIEQVAAAIVDCPHSTPKWTTNGRICVRTTEFKLGHLDLSDVRFVSENTYQERISRLEPASGDILYSREGGILGIACRVPPDVTLCLGQRMMLIRASRNVESRFVMNWLNSTAILDRVKQLTTGSASPHLNVGDVRSFIVPLPPVAEQQRIVAEVDRSLSVVEELEAVVNANLQRATRLRQSILQRAFEGKLVSLH